ncbi:LamG domain-containing protein [Spirosoma gilvum]
MLTQTSDHQWAKSYILYACLVLIVGCDSWNLPREPIDLTEGLVAYYPFNESTVDASSNNLNGILMNGATYGPDKGDKGKSALLLDGIDDYFEIADNANLRPEVISVSLWMKPTTVTTSSHIYNKSNYSDHQNQQYSAFIRPVPNSNGQCCELIADINQDGVCTIEQPIKEAVLYYEPTYQVNRWYHFVAVFARRIAKIYLNGNLKRMETQQPDAIIDRCEGSKLRFGAQAAYDPNNFNGSIDEIRIYNRALTDAEVKALYQQ